MEKSGDSLVRLLVMYVLWTAAGVMGGSFVYLYFRNAGINSLDLVLSFFFWAAAPILLMHFLHKLASVDIRLLLFGAVVVQVASYLQLILLEPTGIVLYVYSFLLGLTSFLFWVPFNTSFFSLGKERAAWLGSIYFSVNPLLAIMLPVIGALLVHSLGFVAVFGSAAVIYIMMACVSLFTFPSGRCTIDVPSSVSSIRGFRTILMLEGAYGGGMLALITVFSVTFFRTPEELGAFIAGTTLFAILASFVVSRVSDAGKKRRHFIRISGSGLGIVSMLSALAATPVLWAIAMSARNFFATLFYPFTTAIMVDNGVHGEHGMIAREWLLNWGRVFGISAVAFMALLGNIGLAFLLLGPIAIVYPHIIEWKKGIRIQ